jgi:transcriptional regulator with XRE-family HTH domain
MGILEGHLIKQRRKALGITQLELAEELGMSHAPIYHLENGKENISLKKLRLILDRIGMDLKFEDKDA